jgi:hypothetical protein
VNENRSSGVLASLDTISRNRLGARAAAGAADRIRRRIVDQEAVAPKLDVAAFNSSI